MTEMISKTVRMPSDLVEFIESCPAGENFSQKLLEILNDYRNGDQDRQKKLQQYQQNIRHYSELYRRLIADYRDAHRIFVSMQHYLSQLQAMAQNPLPDIRADTEHDLDLKTEELPFA